MGTFFPRKSTELVLELIKLDYSDWPRRLELTSLKKMKDQRWSNGNENPNPNFERRIGQDQLFPLNATEHVLQAHNTDNCKHRPRLDAIELFSSCRVACNWNVLPQWVVDPECIQGSETCTGPTHWTLRNKCIVRVYLFRVHCFNVLLQHLAVNGVIIIVIDARLSIILQVQLVQVLVFNPNCQSVTDRRYEST